MCIDSIVECDCQRSIERSVIRSDNVVPDIDDERLWSVKKGSELSDILRVGEMNSPPCWLGSTRSPYFRIPDPDALSLTSCNESVSTPSRSNCLPKDTTLKLSTAASQSPPHRGL